MTEKRQRVQVSSSCLKFSLLAGLGVAASARVFATAGGVVEGAGVLDSWEWIWVL